MVGEAVSHHKKVEGVWLQWRRPGAGYQGPGKCPGTGEEARGLWVARFKFFYR